jgi:hypothetical protein
MNLGAILKMLGVKISPETLAQIEALIPQVPAKANELISANMAAIKNFDERLRTLEELAEQHRLALNTLIQENRYGRRIERDVLGSARTDTGSSGVGTGQHGN